jgi:hypothetical protein
LLIEAITGIVAPLRKIVTFLIQKIIGFVGLWEIVSIDLSLS